MELEPVDHDPFTGSAQLVDMGRLSRLPVPPSSSDAMYVDRFKGFPASPNVEDRRNEIGLRALLQSWTSLTPEDWATAAKHPMTPFWELLPRLPGADNQDSQLAVDAGINNITAHPVDHDPFAPQSP